MQALRYYPAENVSVFRMITKNSALIVTIRALIKHLFSRAKAQGAKFSNLSLMHFLVRANLAFYKGASLVHIPAYTFPPVYV